MDGVRCCTATTLELEMNKLTSVLILSGLMTSVAMAADAPASPHTVAYNVGLTSDYIFRGISQTQNDPALSGGVDYSHASGLYAGTWVSQQKWVKTGGTNAANDPYKTSSDWEMDFYAGYKGSADKISYDIGLIRYFYDGNTAANQVSPDTTEAYLGLTYGPVTAKYSHAISDYFIGWGTLGTTKTKGSNYLELNATHDLGNGWGLLGHIGAQKIKNKPNADYTDWKVGVTKDVGVGTVTVAYSDTDVSNPTAAEYMWDGKDVSKGVLAVSFAKSF